jgi:hypothetical protein
MTVDAWQSLLVGQEPAADRRRDVGRLETANRRRAYFPEGCCISRPPDVGIASVAPEDQAQKTHRFFGGGYRCSRSFYAPWGVDCYWLFRMSTDRRGEIARLKVNSMLLSQISSLLTADLQIRPHSEATSAWTGCCAQASGYHSHPMPSLSRSSLGA